ncbi:MAG TPA: NYN domain-containing protein [Gemmatimonadaceae bacterium]|nr:NYN domain-containing protein [Gemmatimonadaceae bacterium]
MTPRNARTAITHAPAVPVHRGPQAHVHAPLAASLVHAAPFVSAPNAALLIDFDNVTMGIRSDLQTELKTLLSSEIIRGKVAVQRAYADWRRYPQYIVPLTESSIDLIYAPAYGPSKKNATDIRLAIDALELVFTRPEIGTFILLSGDSDFSSLVIKLKEYGKYVIGVGIRESSSDLLVMNCDEYYSYNALAGLVKSGEEETTKRDPWELVAEAVQRMKRNGDVMRADRLKQVMQEIDASFDEKDLGMAKFSRFVQEAAQRGLLSVARLGNGQLEVDVAGAEEERAAGAAAPEAPREPSENGRRSRRGRGGRGRHEREAPRAAPAEETVVPVAPATVAPAAATPAAGVEAQPVGERLTRDEAFSLVRQAVDALSHGAAEAIPAADVRSEARTLLGRDSETLSDRYFPRILRDMHAAGLLGLHERDGGYDVLPVAEPAAGAERPAVAAAAATPADGVATSGAPAAPRRGMRHRGAGRGAASAAVVPPELLAVGVVSNVPTGSEPLAAPPPPAGITPAPTEEEVPSPPARTSRKTAAKKKSGTAKKATSRRATRARTAPAAAAQEEASAAVQAAPTAQSAPDEAAPAKPKPKPRRSRARKKTAAPPAAPESES